MAISKNIKLLNLLKEFIQIFENESQMVVVTGGLGIAGYIGRLYRDFYDLDFTVIGKYSPKIGLEKCKKVVSINGGKVLYTEESYFQSIIKNQQVDIVYIQEITSSKEITYKTVKSKIVGSKKLLQPKRIKLGDYSFNIFRPEIAIIEKLIGSLTLNLIRDKDIEDFKQVLNKLDSRLMFEAMRIKFSYKNNKWDNTGF